MLLVAEGNTEARAFYGRHGLIVERRVDAGGSFSEFMLMDFPGAFFLMGHDGPAHLGIGEGKPTLKELAVFHGKAREFRELTRDAQWRELGPSIRRGQAAARREAALSGRTCGRS